MFYILFSNKIVWLFIWSNQFLYYEVNFYFYFFFSSTLLSRSYKGRKRELQEPLEPLGWNHKPLLLSRFLPFWDFAWREYKWKIHLPQMRIEPKYRLHCAVAFTVRRCVSTLRQLSKLFWILWLINGNMRW